MKYPEKIKDLLKKAKTIRGLSLGECYDKYFDWLEKAEALVKERIKGKRKGLPDDPNYKHSFRVFEIVKKLHHWDDPDFELFIAALLHDIVEDGNTSFEELVDMGFSRRTVELVYLCTHDKKIENHVERWVLLIAKLIKARDNEAWCIKLIDLADNLNQSGGLSVESRKFMIETKAPTVLCLAENGIDAFSYRYYAYLKEMLTSLQIK